MPRLHHSEATGGAVFGAVDEVAVVAEPPMPDSRGGGEYSDHQDYIFEVKYNHELMATLLGGA